MRRLRLELSLSSRGVTIGTATLAYLHDAAVAESRERKRGGRLVASNGKRKRERTTAERREEERQKEKSKVFMDASVRVACICGMGRGPVKRGRTLL